MKLPFEDNSFDAAYAIEATCHAPQRRVYAEDPTPSVGVQKNLTYKWLVLGSLT